MPATQGGFSQLKFLSSTGKSIDPHFYALVTLGKVPGWTRQIFKGFIAAATPPAYIWTGGAFTWRTTATAAEILSSSVNDTAAGTGAKTVLVQGIGPGYTSVSETVTLNGTGAVALVNTYIHINKISVATAGTGLINAGDVTARISGAGATLGHMDAGAGASRNSMFMTAANQVYLSLNQVLSTTSKADVFATMVQEFFSPGSVLTRDNAFPISAGGNSPFVLPQDIPLIVPEKTGFGWRCPAVDSGTPSLGARTQGMFVDLNTAVF